MNYLSWTISSDCADYCTWGNGIIKMYTASLSQLIEAVFGNMVTLKAPRNLTRP